MKQRDGNHDLVLTPEIMHVPTVGGVEQDRILRQHGPFGSACGARCITKKKAVIIADFGIRFDTAGSLVNQALISRPVRVTGIFQGDKFRFWNIANNAFNNILKGIGDEQHLWV